MRSNNKQLTRRNKMYNKNHNVKIVSVGDAEPYGIIKDCSINRNVLLLIIKQLKTEGKALPIYANINK